MLIQLVGETPGGITFAGHSLGGTAAFCLTSQIGGSRGTFITDIGIAFNGGAAPTNPILTGPGPSRFTFYHIFGDLISTHMSPEAAKVVRIVKGVKEFGTVYAHSSARILKSDGHWFYASADEEDRAFVDWAKSFRPGFEIVKSPRTGLTKYLMYLKIMNIVETNPIPGSNRYGNKRKR